MSGTFFWTLHVKLCSQAWGQLSEPADGVWPTVEIIKWLPRLPQASNILHISMETINCPTWSRFKVCIFRTHMSLTWEKQFYLICRIFLKPLDFSYLGIFTQRFRKRCNSNRSLFFFSYNIKKMKPDEGGKVNYFCVFVVIF